MSSKPKKQPPSAAEKASASVAMAEYTKFKQMYDPLLQQMRDKSLTEDVASNLRGRANADTMQALTSDLSYANTQNLSAAGDVAQAYQGQLGVANTSAKGIQNKMQTSVLGTARGQAADAQTGMARASRLATSEALTRAKAKQDVASAKMAAAGQVAGSLLAQGISNMKTSGQSMGAGGMGPPETVRGSFFSPVDSSGQRVSGFKNRLTYSQVF